MRPVPLVVPSQHGVFTSAQAYAAGWTSHALRHAVANGTLTRLRAGVYAEPQPVSGDHGERQLRQRATAVALRHRRATLTSAAAVALHRIPLLAAPQDPCVTYARRCRGDIVGTHLHRARLWTGQITRIGPAFVTTPARSVADLSREFGVDAGIVSADAAVRMGRCTLADLAAAAEDCRGWPFARRAARVMASTDPRAESALESLSRLRMLDAGLPPPAPQTLIYDLEGRLLGRLDFYWDEFGVAGEADGLTKYDNHGSLRAEKRRQGPLEDVGIIFERWGWPDLDAFERVDLRLRAAFARGQRPDRAPRLYRAVPSSLAVFG